LRAAVHDGGDRDSFRRTVRRERRLFAHPRPERSSTTNPVGQAWAGTKLQAGNRPTNRKNNTSSEAASRTHVAIPTAIQLRLGIRRLPLSLLNSPNECRRCLFPGCQPGGAPRLAGRARPSTGKLLGGPLLTPRKRWRRNANFTATFPELAWRCPLDAPLSGGEQGVRYPWNLLIRTDACERHRQGRRFLRHIGRHHSAFGLSWQSLKDPRSHSFYRLFAVELLIALVLVNAPVHRPPPSDGLDV